MIGQIGLKLQNSSVGASKERPPSLRRLSSISGYSSAEPGPGSLPEKNQIERRRGSWILPDRFSNDTSHYIATSKWGIAFERLIMPFSLGSIEAWAVYMLVFAVVPTLPLGVHRWRHGFWVPFFPWLQVLNFVLESVGLRPVFGGDTVYHMEYPPEEEKPGTDGAFSIHIIGGMLWTLCGFLLFFTANKISRKAHRRLAYASGFALFFHLAAASYSLYVNTVDHHHLTRMILFEQVFVIAALVGGGVYSARKKNFVHHQDIMVRAFIVSVEGAGTIRMAAMTLWAIGKFFTPEAASYFDAGACYDHTGTFARNCQGPYMLRFVVLRLVTCYHQAVYLRIPEKVRDSTGRAHLRDEIQTFVIQLVTGVTIGALSYNLDHDMSYLKKYINMVPPEVQLAINLLYGVKYSYDRYKHSHRMLVMPRRNAIIPGRMSLLAAARTASQLALQEIDFSDSEGEEVLSDSDISEKEKKQ